MKNRFERVRRIARWTWDRTSAVIAVVLVLLALAFGYWLGRPDPESESGSATKADSMTEKKQLYTCSMHPEIRLQDKDAKCPICSMDLIPVREDSGDSGRAMSFSEASLHLAEVATATVTRMYPTASTRLFGKVTYDATSVARLTSYFSGRVDRLFVNYVGLPVEAGDHIAEIYSPQLLAALEEFRQASESASSARASSPLMRDVTSATLAAARDKLRLFGLTDTQIETVESGDFVGDRLEIYAPIPGVVTHLAIREGDYVSTGDPIATVANLDRLWIDLEAYESQLPRIMWGQEVSFTVRSQPGKTFRGRVAFVEPMVDESSRTSVVRVAFDNSDGHLKPGMFVSTTIRSRMGEHGVVMSDEFAGRWVGRMHPTIVKDGPGQCDICGMNLVAAEALGLVEDSATADPPLVIPRTAVLFTGERSVVYVRLPDRERPTFEGREISLGPRAGDFYIVRSGLDEGDEIVVNGAFRIDSAMQIQAKPSMMLPPGSGDSDDAGSLDRRVEHLNLPEQFLFSLKPIYAAYLDAQEALAGDDLASYQQAAEDLDSAIGLVSEAGLIGEALASWRRAAAKLRPGSEVSSLDAARTALRDQSAGILVLQRKFGHRGTETWREAFCPMAFDDRGAPWLQRDGRIENPYFGESMLRCGEFRNTYQPLGESEEGGGSSKTGRSTSEASEDRTPSAPTTRASSQLESRASSRPVEEDQ